MLVYKILCRITLILYLGFYLITNYVFVILWFQTNEKYFQCLNCHCIIVKSSITFANFFGKFCDFLHKIIAMRRSWLPCSHLYFYVTRLMWLRALASRQERNSKCWITRRQDLCITFWSMMHHPMLNQVVLQKLLDKHLSVMFVLYKNCLSR